MTQDNNMMDSHCVCMCGKRKTVDMQVILHQLEELVHVMEIECTPAAMDRLRFIITQNGGSLENGKI